jgi:hypothetical protein
MAATGLAMPPVATAAAFGAGEDRQRATVTLEDAQGRTVHRSPTARGTPAAESLSRCMDGTHDALEGSQAAHRAPPAIALQSATDASTGPALYRGYDER